MKRSISVVFASAFALTLAGCAETMQSLENNPKAALGTLAGAAAGGWAGSSIGGGSGRDVAMIGGALLGGFLGNQIGKSLDSADRTAIDRTTQRSLDDNVSYSWQNQDSGRSGTVTPTSTYSQGGRECREFEQTIFIDGRRETAIGTACRQSDGAWRITA